LTKGNKDKGNGKIVSKVFFDKEDWKKEWMHSKQIAKVDPSGKHLLLPVSSCKTTLDKVETHPSAFECDGLQYYDPRHSKLLYQINMPFGGTSLYDFVRSLIMQQGHLMSCKDILELMGPIIHSLVLMDKRQTCHQDIKTSNILVTPQGKTILIDYSLMMKYKDIFTFKNRKRLRYTYFPYPPEYKIAHVLLHDEKCTPCDVVQECMNNIFQYGQDRGQAYMEYVPEREIRASVMKRFDDLKIYKDLTLSHHMKPFANRADVYGVGMCFIDLNKYINIGSLTKKKKLAWTTWIRGMIHPDVEQRFTPSEAVFEYQQLQKLFCDGSSGSLCNGMKKKKSI